MLRLLDRLPAAGPATWTFLGSIFLVDATAGLALGLLASVPVATMTGAGNAISDAMSNRWAFEAVARSLGLDASEARVTAWAGALSGGVGGHAAVLTAMTASATVATVAVLSRQRAAGH